MGARHSRMPAKDQQTEPAAAAPEEPAAAEAEAPAEQLSNEQLVRNQVEYYLSSKNLASDSYLVSKMDSNMWVPISVIANFKMIQSLIGTDENAHMGCMAESTIVLLNRETRCVRPNFKNERNTIMLREIPQATEQSEIKALFGEHEDKIVNLRPEIGDNWYVNFEDEDLAMAALEHLQFGGVTFQGQSVRARIKSENLVRSFIAAQQASQAAAAPEAGTNASTPAQGYYMMPGGYQGNFANGGQYNQRYTQYQQGGWQMPAPGAEGQGKGGKGGKKNGKKKKGAKAGPVQTQRMPPAQLTSDMFPPLPPSPATGGPSGYVEGSYKQYDATQIQSISASLASAAPAGLPQECAVSS